MPTAGETPRFGQHIKLLFRRRDRQSTSFAFDLWSHAEVSQRAATMLGRLQAGTMPCDGAWPKEKIDIFVRGIEAGSSAGSTLASQPDARR